MGVTTPESRSCLTLLGTIALAQGVTYDDDRDGNLSKHWTYPWGADVQALPATAVTLARTATSRGTRPCNTRCGSSFLQSPRAW